MCRAGVEGFLLCLFLAHPFLPSPPQLPSPEGERERGEEEDKAVDPLSLWNHGGTERDQLPLSLLFVSA